MSKKSGGRHSSHVARSDSELTPSVREAKRRVYVILCLGLLAVPLGFSWIPGGDNASYYMTVLLSALLAVTLLWAVHKKATQLVYTPFFIALGIWLAAKLITTVTSILPYHSFWGTYRYWSDGFVYALAVAVIASTVITLRLDRRRMRRLVSLVAAEAVVFAAITVGQAVSAGFFYQKVRPDSPLGNADYFISYLLLFLPVMLVLFAVYLKKRNWNRVTIYGTGSLIMLMALFVSMPTHLQTILLPTFENGKVDTTSGATDNKSITPGNFAEDESNTERWSEWKYGLQFGMTRPLVGTGPSTTSQAFFAAEANHTINTKTWRGGVVMDRSHNDLIEQFSEEGVLGLGAYLVLWGLFIAIVIRRFRDIDPQSRPYAIGMGAGLLLWFGFNQLLFTTPVAGVVAMVWAGLLISMVGSARPVSGRKPFISLAVIAVVLIGLGFWIGNYWVEDTAVDNAINSDDQLSTQASSAALQAAWAQNAATIAGASNDIPDEPYYAEMAAISSLEAYPQKHDPGYQQPLAAQALKYAHKVIAEEPSSIEYMSVLGTVEYAVSPAGSAAEQSGLAEINRAIVIEPNDGSLYSMTAQNGVVKKDYVTARKYIVSGLQAPITVADKQQLRQIAAALPR